MNAKINEPLMRVLKEKYGYFFPSTSIYTNR
jgi:hypothetical protein